MIIDVSPTSLLLFLIVLIFSIGVHEAMHGFAAYWLGDDTAAREGRLTLNPLKHIDPVLSVLMPLILIVLGLPPLLAAKPVPFNPMRVKYDEFGAAMIALAGPLTNFALAAVGAIIWRLGIGLGSDLFVDFLTMFIMLNVGLFVFNMIPFPPLDGSRVLYAVAPAPVQRVMEQIEQFGMIAILLLIAVLLPFIRPFIIAANEAVLAFLL